MEQSTIHIKAPHEVHIGAKVMAARHRISMNQYVIDLIKADMDNNQMPLAYVRKGIEVVRRATPKQKKIIEKAEKTLDEIFESKNKEVHDLNYIDQDLKPIKAKSNICKQHGIDKNLCRMMKHS